MPDIAKLNPDDLLELVESAQDLAAEIDLPVVLERLLSRACAMTDSPDASVIVPDPKSGGLYFAHAVGEKGPILLERWGYSSAQRVPMESVAGKVFVGGMTNHIRIAAPATHFAGVDQQTGKPTASMICVLLQASGERVGVIQILNKRSGDYTERDMRLIEHFAAHAALALRNSQLIRDVLANKGFFSSRDAFVGLKELRQEFSRPAHTEMLTVMMADMRGFTRLCGDVERPERAYELLNQYAGVLADSILDSGGVVHKFLGDGLMALFRGGDHAQRAVRAAFLMTERFDQLKATWVDSLNFDIGYVDIGIGVATDSVMVGTIGSGRVRDLTTVGTAVNLADRYQNSARNGQRIMVDKMTYKAAKALIGECEGPTPCQFSLPGQVAGRSYDRYYLKSLKAPGGGAGNGVSAAAPDLKPALAEPSKGTSVFVSYSHKDREWLDRLQVHLKPLLRGGALSVWDDTKIAPGAKWREEITEALAVAKVAVLLVSPNFLASDFITDKELPKLFEAAKNVGLKILWVPISASLYAETEVAKYQAALEPSRPLDALTEAEQNVEFVKFCQVLKNSVKL